jgi:hypothetical protein
MRAGDTPRTHVVDEVFTSFNSTPASSVAGEIAPAADRRKDLNSQLG